MPAIALLIRVFSLAAAFVFAAFIAAKGIPTLRHDWAWPIDRSAIPAFFDSSLQGWLSTGLGTPNPHPTTYLIALPLSTAMWLFGPLVALALLAIAIGYLCTISVADAASQWGAGRLAAIGLALFALFNPWVYNEVVAGHLVMVLAYSGLIGLVAEMLRGRNASPIRLALWIVLIEAQLQFFLLGMLALVLFAFATRIWLPLLAGFFAGLPSAVGLIAERGTLLQIPYGVEWQANQSVQPIAFLGLGGYFPGYSDALGIPGAAAAWIVLALALAGAYAARRRRATRFAVVAAALISVTVLGVHGPLAAPYAWIVRNVPESGVFRELYDLAGVTAALVIVLACAAAARFAPLAYAALVAGVVLPVTWLIHPPANFWIGAKSYPHPSVAAPAFTRVALAPAFQPLGLRAGGGDGADPDAYVHPPHVAILNEYFPSYPVDMALATYEQTGDAGALRALGVGTVIARPWLVSRTQGGIGLAAAALEPSAAHEYFESRLLGAATPLLAQCARPRIVRFPNSLGGCDVFFGDAGDAQVRPIVAPSESIDPQSAWIDARLAFAESPALAQGLGGALTLAATPMPVVSGESLLAYVRGRLIGSDGRSLLRANGTFAWLRIPPDVNSVRCAGLCELVAQAPQVPPQPDMTTVAQLGALEFSRIAPWLFVVEAPAGSSGLVRLNERYDRAWVAFASGHALHHVRVDAAVNGWMLGPARGRIVLLQVTAVIQLLAEIVGVICVLWLLKAAARGPTKRAL